MIIDNNGLHVPSWNFCMQLVWINEDTHRQVDDAHHLSKGGRLWWVSSTWRWPRKRWDAPPSWKAIGFPLLCTEIQQRVQKLVWEWDPNPPILCAAGLSHTTVTRITCTRHPVGFKTLSVAWDVVICTSPSGLDSVGTLMPSFHRRRRLDMIGHKNYWILSGFCSFGPGRILVHMRFDVQYLDNRRRV